MPKEHMIYEWAMHARGQMVKIPEKINIHEDYLRYLDENLIYSNYKSLWEMFYSIYTDVAEHPDEFNLPLYGADQQRMGQGFNEVRSAERKHISFLRLLFTCGEVDGGRFVADVEKLKTTIREYKKISKVDLFFKKFCDYGFVFNGLKNYKLPSNGTFIVEYPDSPYLLYILKLFAEKSTRFNISAFTRVSYRVLESGIDDGSLLNGPAHIADQAEDENEREFIYKFHQAAVDFGCNPVYGVDGSESGNRPGETYIRYFKANLPAYFFALKYNFGKLTTSLRIRNAEKCMEYLSQCPEDVKDMFRQGNDGCYKRADGSCKGGIRYTFEGEEKWKCCCWGTSFYAPAIVENVPHYIKLVELGEKKR